MTETPEIRIIPVTGLPEVRPGDDLPELIARALQGSGLYPLRHDVLVVAQKVVSKAEGRIVSLESVKPSSRATEWANEHDKDPRVVELVLSESRRIVRMERGVIIGETHHGFVCANAGVDVSNAPDGCAVLLPEDPDASAERIRARLALEFDAEVAVIISDTFGRPWREGLINVAIGLAGIAPLRDYRGQQDSHGRDLRVSIIAVADEIAAAAELVTGKSSGVPATIVRGVRFEGRSSSARELIRPAELDLFR